MVPDKFITLLYKLWLQYKFNIIMFADPNQCNPVEGGIQMCLNLETIEYIRLLSKKGFHSKNGEHFITTKGIFNPLTKSYRNICYFNKTRKAINKECCEWLI